MSLFRSTLRLVTTKSELLRSESNKFNKRRNILVPTTLGLIGVFNSNSETQQQQQQRFLSSTAVIMANSNEKLNGMSFKSNEQLFFPNNRPIMIENFKSLNLQQKNHMSTGMDKNQKNSKQPLLAYEITKNLTLISERKLIASLDRKTMRLTEPFNRPIVLLFAWMLASKKHLMKYAKIYTDLGFVVLTIELNPWQLMWPTKGSQVVAKDVLNFIENNTEISLMTIHGFSVGGYLWGEVMALMSHDLPRYQPFLDKIKAQIWDSAADITEIPIGFPKAVFPNNQTLQKALRSYVVYHMKTFHEVATVHYARSSQLFHFPLLKAPSLFLVSKTDPIGAAASNWNVKEEWDSAGIKTTWKCWDKSPHVQHYQFHRDDYLLFVYKHLEEANVLECAERRSANLT